MKNPIKKPASRIGGGGLLSNSKERVLCRCTDHPNYEANKNPFRITPRVWAPHAYPVVVECEPPSIKNAAQAILDGFTLLDLVRHSSDGWWVINAPWATEADVLLDMIEGMLFLEISRRLYSETSRAAEKIYLRVEFHSPDFTAWYEHHLRAEETGLPGPDPKDPMFAYKP